jgi:hypothetical protein
MMTIKAARRTPTAKVALPVRDLAKLSKEELWALTPGPITLLFDDGVLETTVNATIFSAYMFGPFYREYPKMPALICHHIGNKRLHSNSTTDVFAKLLWHCRDAYDGDEDFIERLCKRVMQITNMIYNDFNYSCEEYVGSLSILDFIDVLDHPAVADINAHVVGTKQSVEDSYKKLRRVLNDPNTLPNNPVTKAVRSGLVSIGQVLQCVGPRGICTDVDSHLFRDPILPGYVQGMRSLADSMKESRSASKAMMFTKDPLQASQYFNRKMQLLAGTFLRLHRGDCGSTTYMPWRVTSSDVDALAGKYHMTAEGLKCFRETDSHLVGTTIQLRTIFHCLCNDQQGRCMTCFGALALSIPKNTNVGHVSTTSLCEVVSQKLLSVKHEDGSASSDGLVLSEYDRNFLEADGERSTIRLADQLDNCKIWMAIKIKEAEHINDLKYTDDVTELSVAMVSTLTEIHLVVVNPKGVEERVTLQVSDGSRKSSLTHDFLAYIKEKGWVQNGTNDSYVIDLEGWNSALPILEMPLKQINMLDYMNMLERFIRATDKGKAVKSLRDFESPEAGLRKLYELVSSRLFMNLAHLEVIVASVQIRSSLHRDYRLPMPGNAVEFSRYNDIMAMRSLSVAMAYERHSTTLYSTLSFTVTQRPDHLLDAMIAG